MSSQAHEISQVHLLRHFITFSAQNLLEWMKPEATKKYHWQSRTRRPATWDKLVTYVFSQIRTTTTTTTTGACFSVKNQGDHPTEVFPFATLARSARSCSSHSPNNVQTGDSSPGLRLPQDGNKGLLYSGGKHLWIFKTLPLFGGLPCFQNIQFRSF